MTNYCGAKFIHNYATLTRDLRELTRKNVKWQWNELHEEAFQTLKQALIQSPVLRYFDPELPTQIHVDASPVGLCAILAQTDENGTEQIVQYASRALTPVEQRYSQTEREALAVVWACEHLHIYVRGSPVTIYTDHKPLVSIFNNPRSRPTARIERWTLRLQPYEATIKYRTGHDNPADYLSRHTPKVSKQSLREEHVMEEYINYIATTSTPKSMTVAEIECSTEQDPTLQAVIQATHDGRWDLAREKLGVDKQVIQRLGKIKNELSLTESGKLVLRGTRIVIPQELQKRIIHLAHAGHLGIVKTKALLREKVWFSGIDRQVEDTIRKCLPCQVTTSTPTQEPLKMSPLPERPWSELSVDFGQVPGTPTHFMVISDDYSRYVIVETVSALTAKAVIPVLDKVLAQFGVPDIIKSDNGPPFNSSMFSDYAKYKGFHHRKITPLWPLANAEVERFMRTVKKTMKAAISEGRNWNQYLQTFLLNYRATPHSSTGVPPATILFGREIKTSLPQVQFKEPQLNIAKSDSEAKLKMKSHADRKNRARESIIKPGDPVLIKGQKNKAVVPYEPKPLVVTERKGSMITAERNGKSVTRNASFFKPSPEHPDDISSDEEEEEDIQGPQPEETPEVPQPPPETRPQRHRRAPERFKDFVLYNLEHSSHVGPE